jgi:hypothetical protein
VKTKLRTIAFTALVLVIGAFAYGILSEKSTPEPRYDGKSLSEWLALYCRPEANRGLPSEAELAVRSIGTNALPFLLESLRYELLPWRETLLKLATQRVPGKTLAEGKIVYGRSLIVGKTARRAERADLGFVILNTNAVLAIPALEALMKNNQKPDMSLRAIYALGEIGGPAIPALTNALADINQTNRGQIIEAIYAVEVTSASYYSDAYKGACLPALTRALNDPDLWVRRQPTGTLHNLVLHNLVLHNLAPPTFNNPPAE